MRICVDLETEQIFFLEQTLASQYLQGFFGAVPLIDWSRVGGGNRKPQFVKINAELIDKKAMARQLRKIANNLTTHPESLNREVPTKKEVESDE